MDPSAFTTSDLDVATTGCVVAEAPTITETNPGIEYSVDIATLSGDGTIQLTIPAGQVEDDSNTNVNYSLLAVYNTVCGGEANGSATIVVGEAPLFRDGFENL